MVESVMLAAAQFLAPAQRLLQVHAEAEGVPMLQLPSSAQGTPQVRRPPLQH